MKLILKQIGILIITTPALLIGKYFEHFFFFYDKNFNRITELTRWRNEFQACFDRVNKESQLLKDEKNATERELDSLTIFIGIVSECISMRDSRLGAEITYDEGDTELKRVIL